MLSYGIFCSEKGIFQYKVGDRPLHFFYGFPPEARKKSQKANIACHHFWLFPEFALKFLCKNCLFWYFFIVNNIFSMLFGDIFFSKRSMPKIIHYKMWSWIQGIINHQIVQFLTKFVNFIIAQPFSEAFQLWRSLNFRNNRLHNIKKTYC